VAGFRRVPAKMSVRFAARNSARVRTANWFHARGTISAGIVEGFNNKAKVTTKKASGFRTDHALEIALYHQLGNLPEPEFAHRFW
jgi:hypothetical protein